MKLVEALRKLLEEVSYLRERRSPACDEKRVLSRVLGASVDALDLVVVVCALIKISDDNLDLLGVVGKRWENSLCEHPLGVVHSLDEVAGDGGQRVRAEAVVGVCVPVVIQGAALKDREVREVAEPVLVDSVFLLKQPLFQRLDLIGREPPLLGVLLDGGVSDALVHELKSAVVHDVSSVHSVLLCAALAASLDYMLVYSEGVGGFRPHPAVAYSAMLASSLASSAASSSVRLYSALSSASSSALQPPSYSASALSLTFIISFPSLCCGRLCGVLMVI